MQLADVRISSGGEHEESLTLAVQAVLRAADSPATADEIGAALGFGLGVRLWRDKSSTEIWVEADRDAHLLPAAELFGIQLRDLHPRPAAAGLEKAPEFQGHFVDSYKPLILRALAHGEAVLAWGGWPAPSSMRWGLLTQPSDEGLGVAGIVWGHDAPVALVSAARQCYVVEEVVRRRPDACAVLGCGVAAAIEEGEALGTPSSAAVGVAAYDWWQAHAGEASEQGFSRYGMVARRLRANFRGAQRFLTQNAAAFGPGVGSMAEALAAEINAAAEALAPVADGKVTHTADLAKVLASSRAHESRIQARLADLRAALGR